MFLFLLEHIELLRREVNMQIFISNKSFDEFTTSFFKFKEKFVTPYNFSYTIIIEKKGDIKRFIRFLNKNDVVHISFMLDISKLDGHLVRLANTFNYQMRINIEKPPTNHQLRLLSKIKVTTRIYDENNEEPSPKYAKNRHIVYRNKVNDTINVAHMISLSLLKTSSLDCNASSCINKTIYYEDGKLYFCPFDKRSYIGNINDLNNLYEVPEFVEILKEAISKRDTCKSSCSVYPICMASCPLKIRQECIKEDYLKEDAFIRNFLNDKKDLRLLENEVIREIVFSFISSKSRK